MDAIFASANNLGIPDLLMPRPEAAAPALVAPFAAWGSVARKRGMSGTWHFYVDDYRFTGLMGDPEAPLRTGATGVVEPNFSIFDETPAAVAAWRIYQKRWIARSWQAARGPDYPIWVDLCVSHAHEDISVLGVPTGWQRFSTRGWERNTWELDLELERAVRISGGVPMTLLVYGGGREVDEWARGRANVLRIPHRRAGEPRPGEGTRRRLLRESSPLNH